jgi:hypothetical protein
MWRHFPNTIAQNIANQGHRLMTRSEGSEASESDEDAGSKSPTGSYTVAMAECDEIECPEHPHVCPPTAHPQRACIVHINYDIALVNGSDTVGALMDDYDEGQIPMLADMSRIAQGDFRSRFANYDINKEARQGLDIASMALYRFLRTNSPAAEALSYFALRARMENLPALLALVLPTHYQQVTNLWNEVSIRQWSFRNQCQEQGHEHWVQLWHRLHFGVPNMHVCVNCNIWRDFPSVVPSDVTLQDHSMTLGEPEASGWDDATFWSDMMAKYDGDSSEGEYPDSPTGTHMVAMIDSEEMEKPEHPHIHFRITLRSSRPREITPRRARMVDFKEPIAAPHHRLGHGLRHFG